MQKQNILSDDFRFRIIRRDIRSNMDKICKKLGYKRPQNDPKIIFEIKSDENRFGQTFALVEKENGKKYVTEIPLISISVDRIYDYLLDMGIHGDKLEVVFYKFIDLTIIHELIHYCQFNNRLIVVNDNESDSDVEIKVESMCTNKVLELIPDLYKDDSLMKLISELEVIDFMTLSGKLSPIESRKNKKCIIDDILTFEVR